jgi:apolipoprotein N-acyltransferase
MRRFPSSPWPGERWTAVGLGVASGTLLALATSPLGLGVLAFPALGPLLFAATRSRSAGTAAASGLACGWAFFAGGFLWLPWNLGGCMWAVWILGAPVLALPIAGFAALVGALGRLRGSATALCAAPALWAALEVGRALGPFGVTWLRLGNALAPWPAWIQLAATGGVELVSAWAAASGAALAHAFATGRRGSWATAAAIPAVGTLFGVASISAIDLRAEPSVRVAAVQPAIAARDRFAPARFDANLGRLLALSRHAAAESPDLVTWPEGSFERAAGPTGAPFLGAIATTLDTPVLAGMRRVARAGSDLRWNSALLAEPGGETRVAADKQRPVPVYERVADDWLAGALARATALPGRVLVGASAKPQTLTLRDGSQRHIGVLICIDAGFPELARDLRRSGADLLVSIANEAESGRWTARQHASIVRLRAVETGLPLVRVANGGPSVWVDPLGREVDRIAAGSRSHVAALGPPRAAPPYVSLGDGPVVAALFLPALVSAVGAGRDARARTRRLTKGTAP